MKKCLRRRSRRDAARPGDVFALEPPHQILDVRVRVAGQVSGGATAATRPRFNEVRADHEGVSRLRRERHLHRGPATLAPLRALPTFMEPTAPCRPSPRPRILLVIPDPLSRSVPAQFISVLLSTVLLDGTVVRFQLPLPLGEVSVVHERPPEPISDVHFLTRRHHFQLRLRLARHFNFFTPGLALHGETSVRLWLENPVLNGMGHIELDHRRHAVDDDVIQVDPGAIVPQWQNLLRGKNGFGGPSRVMSFCAADVNNESGSLDEDEACGGLLVYLEFELQLPRR